MSMCARSFEGLKQFDQAEHNFVNLKPYAESSKCVCKLQTDHSITIVSLNQSLVH